MRLGEFKQLALGCIASSKNRKENKQSGFETRYI